MKKYLKTPRVLRRATLLAMLPVFFLAGCGQKTECEKSIDTAMGTDLPDRLCYRKFRNHNK